MIMEKVLEIFVSKDKTIHTSACFGEGLNTKDIGNILAAIAKTYGKVVSNASRVPSEQVEAFISEYFNEQMRAGPSLSSFKQKK